MKPGDAEVMLLYTTVGTDDLAVQGVSFAAPTRAAVNAFHAAAPWLLCVMLHAALDLPCPLVRPLRAE